jgi:predicted GNAT superfamily acetyltransferase
MNSRRFSDSAPADGESQKTIEIRHCHSVEEFEACVRVERDVWKSADIDVVPIPLFVIASHTGGQVLGAFAGSELVGFVMAIAGWRDGRPFLHSHMAAVADGYRNQGIGRRLKWAQREDALARGIQLIEWTFDPLVAKNAYFNFRKLGVMARRYLPNAYGITTSPLHGSLPTDRLVAEWHLDSKWVRNFSEGPVLGVGFSEKSIGITIPSDMEELRANHPSSARDLQSEIRAEFLKRFAQGYVATAVIPVAGGMAYVLESGSPI